MHTCTYVCENTYIDEYVHRGITVGVSTPLTKSQYVLFTLAAACTRTPNKTARIASILSHPSPDLICACVRVCVNACVYAHTYTYAYMYMTTIETAHITYN